MKDEKMNHKELCELYLNRMLNGMHSTSRTCGNMFFENTKLYSYGKHWVLSEYHPESGTLLVNTAKYSPSTNRQLMWLQRALFNVEGFKKVIEADFSYISGYGKRAAELRPQVGIENLDAMAEYYENRANKARKERNKTIFWAAADDCKINRKKLLAFMETQG